MHTSAKMHPIHLEGLGDCLHSEGLFTWRDPRRWVIVTSCFLYSVYMQNVVLGPSARIFQAER